VTEARATDQLREVLARGFAFVRSCETTEAVSAATFEELLARSIQEIEGDAPLRPGKLSQVQRLHDEVLAAIAQAREMPAETFDLRGAASTREDGTGQEGLDG